MMTDCCDSGQRAGEVHGHFLGAMDLTGCTRSLRFHVDFTLREALDLVKCQYSINTVFYTILEYLIEIDLNGQRENYFNLCGEY